MNLAEHSGEDNHVNGLRSEVAASASVPCVTTKIRGQKSFLLGNSTVALAVTSLGGMLGPARFFPLDERPIEPYHVDLPLQGGSCEATTALLNGHSLIYQRHDLKGLTGPVNPGHHATLQFPDLEGAGASRSVRCGMRKAS